MNLICDDQCKTNQDCCTKRCLSYSYKCIKSSVDKIDLNIDDNNDEFMPFRSIKIVELFRRFRRQSIIDSQSSQFNPSENFTNVQPIDDTQNCTVNGLSVNVISCYFFLFIYLFVYHLISSVDESQIMVDSAIVILMNNVPVFFLSQIND